ncbi:MAG: hypothetical protein IJ676_01330 [Clostridia bacterium]|nr:hypothetical protein [Clostridia bacterium]
MFLTIPKRVSLLTGEARIPENMPLFKITPIKKGVLFYNNAGKLVAQVFEREDGVRAVTLGDGGCVLVERNGKDVVLKQADEKEKRVDESKKRDGADLFFFGNADTYQYEIFRKIPHVTRPVSLVRVVEQPLHEKLVNIKVGDGENVLLAVALALAIGG